jgi:hypothetical protein
VIVLNIGQESEAFVAEPLPEERIVEVLDEELYVPVPVPVAERDVAEELAPAS